MENGESDAALKLIAEKTVVGPVEKWVIASVSGEAVIRFIKKLYFGIEFLTLGASDHREISQ